jgi:threonine/homoserine/homoserine lactone efflux protein
MLALLWNGAWLGFAIAAPVGPIGVLAISQTVRGGRRAGLLTGLGAASADAVFGTAAVFGLGLLAANIAAVAIWTRYAGGAFLLCLGIRMMLARPSTPRPSAPPTGRSLFLSAFLLTLANPMTVLSFAAMLASFGTLGATTAAVAMVAGVFLGSMIWWTVLSCATAKAGVRLSGRWLPWLNRACGCSLVAYGLRAFLP